MAPFDCLQRGFHITSLQISLSTPGDVSPFLSTEITEEIALTSDFASVLMKLTTTGHGKETSDSNQPDRHPNVPHSTWTRKLATLQFRCRARAHRNWFVNLTLYLATPDVLVCGTYSECREGR